MSTNPVGASLRRAAILAAMRDTSGSPRRRRTGVLAVAAAALLFVACSDSAATGGVALIETELADQIGLGELDAECAEPASKEEGERFDCTATTVDGRVIELLGTMTAKDKIDIVTTNLLTVSDLDGLRADAATTLNEVNGFGIAADDIDCGDETLVIEDAEFTCELTDAAQGSVWELIVRTAPYEPDVGLAPAYKVGEQLR